MGVEVEKYQTPNYFHALAYNNKQKSNGRINNCPDMQLEAIMFFMVIYGTDKYAIMWQNYI